MSHSRGLHQAPLLTISIDAGGNLAIWGTAEVATTIMASSIPVLRVLIRDVASAASRNHRSSPHVGRSLASQGSGATEKNHSPSTYVEHEPLPSFGALGGAGSKWSTEMTS